MDICGLDMSEIYYSVEEIIEEEHSHVITRELFNIVITIPRSIFITTDTVEYYGIEYYGNDNRLLINEPIRNINGKKMNFALI